MLPRLTAQTDHAACIQPTQSLNIRAQRLLQFSRSKGTAMMVECIRITPPASQALLGLPWPPNQEQRWRHKDHRIQPTLYKTCHEACAEETPACGVDLPKPPCYESRTSRQTTAGITMHSGVWNPHPPASHPTHHMSPNLSPRYHHSQPVRHQMRCVMYGTGSMHGQHEGEGKNQCLKLTRDAGISPQSATTHSCWPCPV